MSLEALEGRSYGPIDVTISSEKVSEFVVATGDDPTRWADAAPPGFAGALLFRAAPLFIDSAEVGEHTRVLVHSDQRFTWHRPLSVGLTTSIVGQVSRVRVRGEMNFVTFEVSVSSDSGPVLDSVSTFLMGTGAAAEPGPDEGEPPVDAGGLEPYTPATIELQPGVHLSPITRSASRSDLVRYAGASGDFNPIHFDHDAARRAGLDGIVVHGLCMTAWLTQVAATGSPAPDPLAEIKVRFRSALRPAQAATITAECVDVSNGVAAVTLRLGTDGEDLVNASSSVRIGA